MPGITPSGCAGVEGEDAFLDHVDVEQAADTEAGAVGRDAADELDGRLPGRADADVVDHLARAQLEGADHARVAGRGGAHGVVREGPERDRSDHPDPVTGLAQAADRVAHELRRRAERDDHRLGVVEERGLDAHLALHVRDLARRVLRAAFLAEGLSARASTRRAG